MAPVAPATNTFMVGSFHSRIGLRTVRRASRRLRDTCTRPTGRRAAESLRITPMAGARGVAQPGHGVAVAIRDVDAFRSAVEPYRAALHAHCYRMLGSVCDADDALQDALLRAWRGLPRFEAGRSLRPWLYKIATNVCVDMLAKRERRFLPFDRAALGLGRHRPLPDAEWITPYPDEALMWGSHESPDARFEQREAVELAFIAALQLLPARQRASLVLKEVLGFSAAEIAEILDTTTAAVNSALQRARSAVNEQAPGPSQAELVRSLGDHHVRRLAERFATAMETGDIQGVVSLLDSNARFAMPPYPD